MFKILRSINQKKWVWAVLAVVVILLTAYGQTLGMYFWQDDSALIFKLQNPQGPAGSYGEGIIGNGPYKYLITLFVPFFPLFKLNPFWYFLAGFAAYFLSTGAFYLFASALLKKKQAVFFSTIIYAAGYIGSDTMFRISNSWQTNLGLILALLSLWAYVKFFQSNSKYWYYAIALIFFYSSVEFVFIRSHSLIFPLLAVEFIFIASSFKVTKIPMFFIRQFPFWFIFYTRYLIDRSEGGLGLNMLLKNLVDGKVEILSSFFATLGNSLIPTILQGKFVASVNLRTQLVLLLLVMVFNLSLHLIIKSGKKSKIFSTIFLVAVFFLNRHFISKDPFWYRSQLDFVAGGLGMYAMVIISCLAIVLWKSKKILAIGLIFGLVILASQIFGYFIKYPDAIFATTHRYLSYAFVGYSLIVGVICFLVYELFPRSKDRGIEFLFKNNENIAKRQYLLALIPLGLVLTINLYLGVTYQNKILKDISKPTNNFYISLKQFVPQVKLGDVFYFDVEVNGFTKAQFNNFFSVGSMPDSTALAIYYNVDRYDILLISDFNELLNKLSQGQIKIDDIHSFYYGSAGLVDTSVSLKSLLKSGSAPLQINSNKLLWNDLSLPSLSPILLTVKAKITPDLDKVTVSSQNTLKDNPFKIISYLLSRQDYYKSVQLSSSSQWKFQEVSYLTDDDLNTSWRAHRIHWHDNRREEIIIDLGSLKKIGGIRWTNWRNIHTPIFYDISVSVDGKTWKIVKQVENGVEEQENKPVVEYFNDELVQFVRMNITQTFSGEEPALAELEVLESSYKDIDIEKAFAFINAPLSYFSKREENEQILWQAAPFLNLRVAWETNKGKGEKKVPIGVFGNMNTYEFIIDAGGTVLKNVTLSVPNIPAKIDVQSVTVQNLSLSEMENRKLIKNVVEN